MTSSPSLIQMHFLKSVTPSEKDLFFIFKNNEVMLVDGKLPTFSEIIFKDSNKTIVFKMTNTWAVSGNDVEDVEGGSYHPLRSTLDQWASPLIEEATQGAQCVNWNTETQYCSQSGGLLEINLEGLFKFCTESKKKYYPKLSPVVIVLVYRGQEILLARGLPPKKHYSCIAGFVEPGESIEEAILREVKEEVGVNVKNIKYFSSQSWPFPDNLMLGFTAEWVSGEIDIKEDELTDAKWFSQKNLPEVLPPKASIARKMIDQALAIN